MGDTKSFHIPESYWDDAWVLPEFWQALVMLLQNMKQSRGAGHTPGKGE